MAGHIWLTDLAAAARTSGLSVIEVPGWRTRTAAPRGGRYGGPGLDAVRGLMIHHTATPEGYRRDLDYPTYNVILQGNGSTGGPLSQLGLCRCGKHVYVFAAGICWHAGAVRDYSTQGNRVCIGIEAEHSGQPRDMPWPKNRYDGYVALAAAIAEHYDIPTRHVVGHKEASTTGKIDPLFDMTAFRRHVNAARQHTTPPAAWEPGWIAARQRQLNELGYTGPDGKPLVVDDSLGPATTHAVTTYQHDAGLDPDGKPGPLTAASLEETMNKFDALVKEVRALRAAVDATPGRVWQHKIPFDPKTSIGRRFGKAWRAGGLAGYAALGAIETVPNARDEILAAIDQED